MAVLHGPQKGEFVTDKNSARGGYGGIVPLIER